MYQETVEVNNQSIKGASHKGSHVTKDAQLEFDFNQPTHQERVLAAFGDYMSRKQKVKHGR